MPFVTRDTTRLYWRADGHSSRPALLLLNSLGTDLAMWDAVVPLLTDHHWVVRMDTRGHGASDAPAGDYTIPQLADDAFAVLDSAGVRHASVCGISMGGMITLQMAATRPERVEAVVACNTSAAVPADPWRQRAELVREKGVGAIAEGIMSRFFSAGFREGDPPRLATARFMFLSLSAEGYAGCCAAIAGLDVAKLLPFIAMPLLVVNGALDEATPPREHGERIAAAAELGQHLGHRDAGLGQLHRDGPRRARG